MRFRSPSPPPRRPSSRHDLSGYDLSGPNELATQGPSRMTMRRDGSPPRGRRGSSPPTFTRFSGTYPPLQGIHNPDPRQQYQSDPPGTMYPQGGATPVAPVNWERKKMHGKSKSNGQMEDFYGRLYGPAPSPAYSPPSASGPPVPYVAFGFDPSQGLYRSRYPFPGGVEGVDFPPLTPDGRPIQWPQERTNPHQNCRHS
jgi:hypothetical protein